MDDPNAERDWLPPLRGRIAPTVTVEALYRNVPDDTWDMVDVVHDPQDCMPGLTMCSDVECMEGWLVDHFLRVLDRGVVVWTSPDLATGTPATPEPGMPSADAVVIPFRRR